MPSNGQGTGTRLWTPSDGGISGPLTAWYHAQRTDTIDIATGVSTWRDLSGNGNTQVQATTTKQPAYPRIVNGRPYVDFDGTDDYLAMSASTLNFNGTVGTCYVVCIVDAATNERLVGMSDNTAADYSTPVGWSPLTCDGTNFYQYHSNSQSSHIARTLGSPVILVASRNGSAAQVYKNETAGTSDASDAGTFASTRMTIACNYTSGSFTISGGTLNGAFGEILLYNAAHNIATQSHVARYLSYGWGIPLDRGGASSPPLVFA